MRHYFLLFFFIGISFYGVQAQEIELGGGAALIQYKGDLNPSYNPFRSRPGVSLFARYNTEKGINFRLTGLAGQIAANTNKVQNPFTNQLNRSFARTFYEFSTLIEYNFLDFRTKRSRFTTDWSPYVFAGASLYALDQLNNTKFSYPLGFGVKKELTTHLNFSAEFGTRFTNVDDAIDGFGYPRIDPYAASGSTFDPNDPFSRLTRRLSYPSTLQMDKYFIFQVSVSYLFQRVYCPK